MSAVRKLKPKPQPRVFHATVLVTRAEEWWVEADTAKEARALFASGPFTPGNGASIGDGLSVFRAVSLDEAKVFANSDPLVLAGARSYDIREWTVMEGSIGITVGFSEGGYRID